MDVYYINHNGRKIDFMNGCYNVENSSFFEHSWDYESTSKDKINRFKKGVQGKSFDIHINGKGLVSCEQAQAELLEVIEADLLEKQPGRLYVNDYYIRGYIISGKPKYFVPELDNITRTMQIVSDHSFWIKELKKQFRPQTAAESAEGLDFPFDFPFDFAPPAIGQAAWKVDHYTSSHFLMTIHGPCVDPIVRINGYPYQIHTVLEAGTYLTIDSRANEVYKYLANGSRESLYNSRDFAHSVFEKIPSGLLQITWPGTFGFDITLFLERSEPRW